LVAEFNNSVCPLVPKLLTLDFWHELGRSAIYQVLSSRLGANAVGVETPLGREASKIVSSRTLTQSPKICQVLSDRWVGMMCKRIDELKILDKNTIGYTTCIRD
jgi:hypothetical protein